MKNLRGLLYVVGASLLGIGVATVVTNPRQAQYEEYATRQLSAYLQQNVCPNAAILDSLCRSAVRDNQAQIRGLIAANTERQNYLFWSVYQTELAPGELLPPVIGGTLPAYHFESVGVFSSFHTYRADRI
ncbi:DUF4359 domain-containing protein [Egbenema bharatensis]|uniref:DUF4359 domain-containing protein n=1 Tax=Egbenema bharatensis TaxID=3463334 RepID=UPI003A84E59E